MRASALLLALIFVGAIICALWRNARHVALAISIPVFALSFVFAQGVNASSPESANPLDGRQLHTNSANAFDIYLVLDTSPSMLLPSTRAGMQQLAAATSTSHSLARGCAYACHERVPFIGTAAHDLSGQVIVLDRAGKRVTVDPGIVDDCLVMVNHCELSKADSPRIADSFWLARNYGSIYGGNAIELRIDSETSGARGLLAMLRDRQHKDGVRYRMQTFGFGMGDPVPLAGPLAAVSGLAPGAIPDLAELQPEWFANNCPTEKFCNSDRATDFGAMLKGLRAIIPPPGNGTAPLMLIVTDGMSDDGEGNVRHVGGLTTDHLAQCAAIRQRGIRIAILYLEYATEPLQGDPWSQYEALPHIGEIEPALTQCASAPGGRPLLHKVRIGQSIPVALQSLANDAIRTPY